jgi:hypothetical protein
MLMGSVSVMPTPTAAPGRAPMVGMREWWIRRAMRPPLKTFSWGVVVF